ncbi:MAG: hypothetical protein ACPHS7_01795 [Candidatus Puniceispirillaceae bacterium]
MYDAQRGGGMMAVLDKTFWSKTQKAIMLCNRLADPRLKMAKAEILTLSNQKIALSMLFNS